MQISRNLRSETVLPASFAYIAIADTFSTIRSAYIGLDPTFSANLTPGRESVKCLKSGRQQMPTFSCNTVYQSTSEWTLFWNTLRLSSSQGAAISNEHSWCNFSNQGCTLHPWCSLALYQPHFFLFWSPTWLVDISTRKFIKEYTNAAESPFFLKM